MIVGRFFSEAPMSIPGQLTPTPRLLLGPGPSDAHPRVLTAMTTPLLGHLDPQFLEIMLETQEMLRQVYRTKNRLTFPVSATGTAGMETCLVNLIQPGDSAVVATMGYFGNRMVVDIAGRCGAKVTTLEAPWGTAFDPDKIRDTVKQVRPKVLALVHAETSTGVLQDLVPIGENLQGVRHAAHCRLRYVARMHPARNRRLGRRCRVQLFAERPRLPPGDGPGHIL